jgi:hypothetical protein
MLQEIDEPADEEDEDARDDEDADREASDEALLDEVNAELDRYREVDEHDIPVLTREDINIGRFAISKVSPLF